MSLLSPTGYDWPYRILVSRPEHWKLSYFSAISADSDVVGGPGRPTREQPYKYNTVRSLER